MSQKWVPGRHCHHKRIAPHRYCHNSIADFIGLREADVIQIILKAFYLLRKRHLKKPEFNFRLFLPTERKQYR
ncbi:hypothetical protein AW898_12850 [Pseudomonas aeruginosa]|nr:hypothetical protein Z695_0112550 [Pseudomonas aeruginosa SG17M]KXC89639.1 hypothetical protein AW897_13025 [Pseudomonas aeruginosa]KXC91023.1 hypothetical protein AW899_13905 [Pseudomonas aeruginosa]KXC99151.1 hypothetical protein AW898_12850 [Pseudomonas aeruginosa]KXD02138.1 hypothetical protein AW900_12370 [Pseudomonas aeruginosa]